MNEPGTIAAGSYVRIRLRRDCDGGGRPHNPVEEGMHAEVTAVDCPGDHSMCALFRSGGARLPFGTRLPLGRYFRPDELEPIARTV